MCRYVAATTSGARRPALFCDRDGVINRRNPQGYVTKPEEFELLEVALPALRSASRAGAAIVVVSNQGAIARGLVTGTEVLLLHAMMLSRLEGSGVTVDGLFVCPHHPLAVNPADRSCRCRKPAPGMLLAAAADMDIDLARSIMIGDQASDRSAAIAAGIPAGRSFTVDAGADSRAVERAVAEQFARSSITTEAVGS